MNCNIHAHESIDVVDLFDGRKRLLGRSAKRTTCGGEERLSRSFDEPTGFASGLASMIIFQLIVNVGMVMGVMPITGIPLPFVTHGGASLVSMAIGLGILQSINIRQTRAEW